VSAEVLAAAGEKLVVMVTRDKVHVRAPQDLALKAVRLQCPEGFLNLVPDHIDSTTVQSLHNLTLANWPTTSITATWTPAK